MHKLLIENYISKISKKDVSLFALNNGISLNSKDIDILYHYLKNKWEDLIYGNREILVKEIKGRLSDENSTKIEEVFNFYLNKYQDFL